MDGNVLFKILLAIILQYFEVVLQTLQKYFITINIRKCMFLGTYQKLIGVEICDKVNTQSRATHQVLRYPHISRNVQVLRPVDTIFQFRVLPCQSLLKQGHGEGSGETVQYQIICGLWNNEDITILENIKKEAVAGPILTHTKVSRRT